MARREHARPPVYLPFINEMGKNDVSWEKFLTEVAKYSYRWDIYDVTINPSSVGANTTSEQTFSVSGVSTNDWVDVKKPTHTAGIGIVNVRVSAKDTIAITFSNSTGGAIDPPSETYKVKVEKR